MSKTQLRAATVGVFNQSNPNHYSSGKPASKAAKNESARQTFHPAKAPSEFSDFNRLSFNSHRHRWAAAESAASASLDGVQVERGFPYS